MKSIGNNKIYSEKADLWAEYCSKDYLINEETKVQIVENGIILPLKKDDSHNPSSGIGGVCDASGNFIDGHKSDISIVKDTAFSKAYPIPNNIKYIKETVVYGGLTYNHFGHFITECLTRMWWFLENPDCGYKFVFVTPEHHPDNSPFLEFYYMLGLKKENIVILREPTRFGSVIIPEQSTYLRNGYKPNAMSIYNAIRDSVPAAKYEKVYFTRSKLKRQDTVNEEYFEDYFRLQGYEIIAPEQLSIKEQVAIIAGAKEYACVSGSLHHHILFAHDGINITLLNRSTSLQPAIYWINQAKNAKFKYVDVFMNFLPAIANQSLYLLMPTDYWKAYIKDKYDDSLHMYVDNISDIVYQYIIRWAKMMANTSQSHLKWYKNYTLADIIVNIHKYLIGKELDESVKKKLTDVFCTSGEKILMKISDLKGNIEKVSINKDTKFNNEKKKKEITLFQGEDLCIQGWIVNGIENCAFKSANIYIDNLKYEVKSLAPRKDVARTYGEQYLSSGFVHKMPLPALSTEENHTVKISGIAEDGVEHFLKDQIVLIIESIIKKERKEQLQIYNLLSKTFYKKIKIRVFCSMRVWNSLESLCQEYYKDFRYDFLLIPYSVNEKIKDIISSSGFAYKTKTEYDVLKDKPDIVILHSAYSVYEVFDKQSLQIIRENSKILINIPYGLVRWQGNTIEFYTRNLLSSSNMIDIYVLDKFLYSEIQKAELLQPKMIYIGNPKFDSIYEAMQEKAEIPNEWRKIIGKKVFLLTTDHVPLDDNITFDLYAAHFFDWFDKNHNDCALIIRPHPAYIYELLQEGIWTKEDYENIKKYCENSDNIIWDERNDYSMSYSLADCVFTDVNCGIILSALTLDKPICVLRRYDGKDFIIPHPNIIEHHNVVNSPEELVDFLERIRAGEDPKADLRREAFTKFISHYDGKNGQRIKDFIEEKYNEKFNN